MDIVGVYAARRAPTAALSLSLSQRSGTCWVCWCGVQSRWLMRTRGGSAAEKKEARHRFVREHRQDTWGSLLDPVPAFHPTASSSSNHHPPSIPSGFISPDSDPHIADTSPLSHPVSEKGHL